MNMASNQQESHGVEDVDSTDLELRAKRLVRDEDQYKKVLDRPYVTPSLSVTSKADGNPPTSHYNYNFDEKDYKNRRKISTKYHEPLRRISTHHGELSSHDKKSSKKHHKKKHKTEHSREAKLQKLINQNNEEEKTKSKEETLTHRHIGAVVFPEEVKNKLEIDENDKSESLKDNNKDSIKVPADFEIENFSPLASKKDDCIVGDDISEDVSSPVQVQFQKEQKHNHTNQKTEVVKSAAEVGEEDISSKSECYVVDGPQVDYDDDDDNIGIQMHETLKKEEVSNHSKQIKKIAVKDRDSSVIDIMPEIKEHDELSFDPISMTVDKCYVDKDKDHRKETEQDIESHHRDKHVGLHHLEVQSQKRRHHRRHRKHEVKQHRTISEREAMAEKFRLRSGLLTLQETEPRVDDFAKRYQTEEDEEANLEKKDLDEIAWHRFEDLRGLRRRRPQLRKPRLKSGMLTRSSSTDTLTASVHQFPVKYDHSPHEAFIELQELTDRGDGLVWKETARWIKFEEDVEASNNRWGKPHVASLTFHSLLELRKGLEKGTVLLDLEQFDLQSIVDAVVENMVITDQIVRSDKEMIVGALLSKHKHQYQEEINLPRRPSFYNLMTFSENVSSKDEQNYSYPQTDKAKGEDGVIRLKIDENVSDHFEIDDGKRSLEPLYVSSVEEKQNPKREVSFAPSKPAEKETRKNESNVKSRIPTDAEATAVMVGSLKKLESPVLAFVRIAKGCYLGDLTEVNIPVRFIFVMLGPPNNSDTYYEMGRSISTLMSDQIFHDLAYYSESREDILHAINEFLDDTVVLPPGEWDRQLLIPLLMKQSKVMAKRRKEAKQISAIAIAAAEEEEDPLKRTGRYCGGLIRDVKRRAECYISDFKDGFNLQSLWVTIFLYFAVFAPNIAFGGLLAEKTEQWLGVSEVIFGTCMCGILFGFFSGQPLIIIGATGPILVFEQAIYQFCKQYGIEFLPWRFWIGTWVMILLFVVVTFEGCFLVRYFSRFTEEIFGCLISAIFIYEAMNFLVKVRHLDSCFIVRF